MFLISAFRLGTLYVTIQYFDKQRTLIMYNIYFLNLKTIVVTAYNYLMNIILYLFRIVYNII